MKRMLLLGASSGLFALFRLVTPAAAQDPEQTQAPCYWCMRDAIYADTGLIDHLEANPDIDDAVKGPQIVASRADIHRLRAILGPAVDMRPEPCCYSRPPLHIR